MSSAAISFVSTPTPSHFSSHKSIIPLPFASPCKFSSLSSSPPFSFRFHHGSSSRYSRSRSFSPTVMEWQDCTVKRDVDVPVDVAYNCYLDRESIPRWMPFISSVKVLEDKPELSRWSLKYEAFGRDIEYAWLARNMQPIPNQKIHWRSLEGLPNRGAVRFFPKGPTSCTVEALQPFLEGLLKGGLERFAAYAKSSKAD